METIYIVTKKDKNGQIKWVGNYAWKIRQHAVEIAEEMSKDMGEKYTIHTLELNW